MKESCTERAKRHEVNFVGRLESLTTDKSGEHTLDIDIVDLSTGGAALCCDERIEPQSTWMLRLEPLLCSGFSEAVVIRWCREDGERFRCGVQFISGAALFMQAGLGLQPAVEGLQAGGKQPSKLEIVNPDAASAVQFSEPSSATSLTGVYVGAEQALNITSNMIDCKANLGGPLHVGQTLAGGHLVTSNTIEVTTLGQPDRPTSIVVGSLPKSNVLVARVPKQLDIFEKQIEEADSELKSLTAREEDLVHSERERVMELEFELPGLLQKRDVLQGKYDELLNLYKDKISIEIRVNEAVHEGVVIECYGRAYRFTQQLTGPFIITADKNNQLVATVQDQPQQSLNEYAEVDHSTGLDVHTSDAA